MLPTTPSFRLDGRLALVTGAGRGIGVALAAALAQAGAMVTLAARTGSEIEAAADEIRKAGGKADTLVIDVTDTAAFRAAMDARAAFDIFVNNAGTNRPSPFLEVTEPDFDAVIDLNVRAAFFAAQAVARRMATAGVKGSIINISSQAGHIALAARSTYSTSKFAVEGMTKSMATDLAGLGIRVNSLCPTFIETAMTRPALSDPAFRAFVTTKIKLGRVGAVEDLMGAVVFLASDASALMTGSALIVDGGWTTG
ncbi:SDR family oxidoreductase [Phreatobacter aquaticus]|uniref:SDR family oxidoreductase n=1 Tax=Phreatobacter aquaticus TaxID=2570229 RepID=A0A4D7QLQ4_9HYPH|nr:SDR family NAD(P)-dependent oxidoreductase [Phreatobacter aquaticus]QCK86316.1 SDR family oxidoreductase [Phreatobacter aquaticus]